MNPAIDILKKFTWQIVGGLLLLVLVLVLLKKTGKGLFSIFSDQNKDELTKAAESNIKSTSVSTSRLSFDKTYYTTWANKFYQSMYGWAPYFVNRYSEQDYLELESLNADELKMIFKEFGVKRKENWLGLHYQTTGTLFDWFENELTGTELERIKSIFRKTGLWG